MRRNHPLAVFLALLLTLTTSTPAFAHDGAASHDLSSLWHWDPLVLLGLILGAWLYARGIAALWRRGGVGRGVRRWQAAAFAAGLAVLAIALLSPLAGLAEELFSAHMAQHLLLLLVAPPLLLLGAPEIAGALGLPRRWRRPLAGTFLRVERRPFWHSLGTVGAIWVVQMAALWLWHLPRFYEAALESDIVHGLEHVTFLVTALLFWAVVLRPFSSRRASFGVAIVFVIATALPNGLLGALMTLTSSPWYPAYAARVTDWGMTPLVDQQIGGLLMWIPPGTIYVVLVAGLLLAWLERAPGRGGMVAPFPARPSPQPPPRGHPALCAGRGAGGEGRAGRRAGDEGRSERLGRRMWPCFPSSADEVRGADFSAGDARSAGRNARRPNPAGGELSSWSRRLRVRWCWPRVARSRLRNRATVTGECWCRVAIRSSGTHS
jgi:putative membrane protein